MTDYIWTNHARQRLSDRKIPQRFIDQVLQNPDRSVLKKNGAIELQKRIEEKTAAALVKENERGEHLIVSVWIDPPYQGTRDHKLKSRYNEMKRASLPRQLWLTLLNQLGL